MQRFDRFSNTELHAFSSALDISLKNRFNLNQNQIDIVFALKQEIEGEKAERPQTIIKPLNVLQAIEEPFDAQETEELNTIRRIQEDAITRIQSYAKTITDSRAKKPTKYISLTE